MARALSKAGYQVLTATDGQEAVALVESHPADIRCVVMDLTMPNMDGQEAFQQIRRLRPNLPVVLSSGYNEQEVINQFRGKGLAGFIQKPYVYDELIAVVLKTIQGAGPAKEEA